MRHLSLSAARALHLAAQGLRAPPRHKASRDAVLATIRRMALLQIDTISVVARSPYFVLWSRLGAFDPAWLDGLLAEGALFEYWAHEACLVPIEDYRLLRHRMLDPAAMGWKYSAEWAARHRTEIEQVLERVKRAGPVRAADFERRDGGGKGWWDWKPEKRHLEVLFTLGRLMVARRQSFQRVYDLAERVLPGWDDRDALSSDAARREMLKMSCRALGLALPAWVADYYRIKRQGSAALLEEFADAGELTAVRVEGWASPAYVHRDHAALLDEAQAGTLASTVTTLLSPFDPVVWDRKRALELFGFDYRIECYTPETKRQYGYFVLPILARGRLVGRLDAKAHRAQRVFEIKSIHLEAGVRPSLRFGADLGRCLRRCADWHGCPQLRISAKDNPLGAVLSIPGP
ncbi:winged helix-turn-helix domain-containing protein [Niveibacterium terrae]|uniref:winged helix-turn-helix domain-containing protein n=1 Tax=Niveibacterium terrae TaxID=3373598 RepID=UPI003A92C362